MALFVLESLSESRVWIELVMNVRSDGDDGRQESARITLGAFVSRVPSLSGTTTGITVEGEISERFWLSLTLMSLCFESRTCLNCQLAIGTKFVRVLKLYLTWFQSGWETPSQFSMAHLHSSDDHQNFQDA